MGISISVEQKQKAIQLYKNKTLTISEISNLTDISEICLTSIFHKAFELGILKPRNPNTALKHRPAKGMGKSKKYVATGIGYGGRNKERKKFSDEQEQEIAKDYYKNGYTISTLKEKWNIHPMQLQYVRNKYASIYGGKSKTNPNKKNVIQLTKDGEIVAEFESGLKASKETGICYVNINQCCNGHMPSAGGYLWRFKDNE